RFLDELSVRHGVDAPVFDRGLRRRLANYHWPGNVRELRNLVERCVVLLHGRTLGADDLPREWLAGPPAGIAAGWSLPAQGVDLGTMEAELIAQALKRTGGNRTRAARLLGLTRHTLLYRMKKHAIA